MLKEQVPSLHGRKAPEGTKEAQPTQQGGTSPHKGHTPLTLGLGLPRVAGIVAPRQGSHPEERRSWEGREGRAAEERVISTLSHPELSPGHTHAHTLLCTWKPRGLYCSTSVPLSAPKGTQGTRLGMAGMAQPGDKPTGYLDTALGPWSVVTAEETGANHFLRGVLPACLEDPGPAKARLLLSTLPPPPHECHQPHMTTGGGGSAAEKLF